MNVYCLIHESDEKKIKKINKYLRLLPQSLADLGNAANDCATSMINMGKAFKDAKIKKSTE